jgi:hypothetical protein
MKKFLIRIFCLHLNWIEAEPKNYHSTHWICTKCGKRKLFENNKPPIQFIE